VRPFPRLLAARTIAATAVASLLFVGLLESCGTEAVGIEACRQIEAARCAALKICPVGKPAFKTDTEVEACSLFYRDQCLHGINNAKTEPDKGDVDDCVKAVKATADCAKMGAKTLAECPGASAADLTLDPCIVISMNVEKLNACDFVVAQGTGGASSASSASSSSSSSSASGAGGASSSSGTSSSSSSSSSSGAGDAGTD
jgi:hypothetical protein